MRSEILSVINDPKQMEKLYRDHKAPFKREFSILYPELKGNMLADFWNERLTYETEDINWGSRTELLFVVLACVLAGVLAKLPAFLPISEEFYYPRNVGFIVFPLLTAYFAWKNKLAFKTTALIAGIPAICLFYINLLPHNLKSDTLLLACIHLPFLLWNTFGVAFAGKEPGSYSKRLQFLRFNGDLVVMSALLVLAGILMTGITLGLFSLIGFKIEEVYFEYIVAFGLPAVPIMATFLTQTNPQLVNKVSPVIAKLFSPLVLVMLVIYVGAIIASGKDPYNDRDFLLLFNGLLIGVMALVFFSVAETSTKEKRIIDTLVLFLLSVVTIVVNGIALSAIVFRISEWGITPNRLAVLGGNVLILVHLLIVALMLFKALLKKASVNEVGKSIALYLPVYFIWAAIVVFLFPVIFGFN